MNIFALFVHTGRHDREFSDTLLIPVGLIPLVNFLNSKGFKSLILNNSLNILKKGEDIDSIINRYNPAFLCLTLQWHFQIKDTLELIKKLKKKYPDKKIVLGGFTASYFAREIMEEIPEVDFIIRGDAEIPLLKLFSLSLNKGKIKDIPNLLYREGDKICQNKKKFLVNRSFFDLLDYANYDYVINKDEILNGSWRCLVRKEEKFWDDDSILKPRAYYTLSRGCCYNCSFCGGSKIAQEIISGRKSYVAKSHQSVIKDIKGLLRLGIKSLYFCGLVSNSKYFSQLFRRLRQEKISFNVVFEGCGLPAKNFLEEFALTFRSHLDKSRLIFFPESGSEKVRKLNKGIFFTNIQIFKALDIAKKLGINIEVRFIAGLPGETTKTFMETLAMAKIIKKRYGFEVNIHTNPLEPGSPMYSFPEKYNIKNHNCSFKDYLKNPLNYHEKLGYESKTMSLEEIQKCLIIFQNIVKKDSEFLI